MPVSQPIFALLSFSIAFVLAILIATSPLFRGTPEILPFHHDSSSTQGIASATPTSPGIVSACMHTYLLLLP